LLHTDRQNQATNDRGSTGNNLPANAKGISTAEVNTYCSLKDKPRNHILLAKAIVKRLQINLVNMFQAGQYLSITFHNREMRTTLEVIKDPDTCLSTGH